MRGFSVDDEAWVEGSFVCERCKGGLFFVSRFRFLTKILDCDTSLPIQGYISKVFSPGKAAIYTPVLLLSEGECVTIRKNG